MEHTNSEIFWKARLQTNDFVQQTAPDPFPQQNSKNGWKMLAALAVGVGIALVGAFVGVRLPNLSPGQ